MRMQDLALCPSNTELPRSIHSALWERFDDLWLYCVKKRKLFPSR